MQRLQPGPRARPGTEGWHPHMSRIDNPYRWRVHRRVSCAGAGKSTDQHEQRRLRQMEVCHQHVHRPKAIARGDENRRVTHERAYDAVLARTISSSRSDVVPTATIRPPARRALLRQLRSPGINFSPFGVHAMPGGVVSFYGQEGASTDMECHALEADAPLH